MRRIVLLLSAMAAALLLASWVGLFNAVKPAEATFPGQNGRIVFSSVSSREIFTINPDGSGKFTVTNNNTNDYDYDPSYSPDGQRIVYSGYGGNGSDEEIFTINVGGGTPVQITNNDTDDYDPAYSPDGKRIAYEGEGVVYKTSPTGGTPVKLTNGLSPVWGNRP